MKRKTYLNSLSQIIKEIVELKQKIIDINETGKAEVVELEILYNVIDEKVKEFKKLKVHAGEELYEILGDYPVLDDVLSEMAIEITNGIEYVLPIGNRKLKPYTIKELQENDNSFSLNKNRMVVFFNEKAYLLPKFNEFKETLLDMGFEDLSKKIIVPLSNGGMPRDENEAAKFLASEKCAELIDSEFNRAYFNNEP